ncbi:hypothetical protein [Aurantiacibacter spongiae]|uniref:Uncharacterized protein n=1 Tax=Aurantiacibacter spongiae TaxID=2488860 RepID=A0A3N5CT47_9SPHN|nr:hypothetical protein [Aurantiacibacter spongiae]RPF72354.1 hypothetical protein EG799_12505 [Aurantiacibacter spongiae]
MKRLAFTAAALATLAAAPVAAQDAGTTIMGNDDAAVGTVLSNDGTTVVIDTGTHQVPLGTAAFAETDGTWTLNTTKAELDTAYGDLMAQQQAALDAALVEGAAVATADAMPLGTVESLDEANVVVVTEAGPMSLERAMFAVGDNGGLMVLANHADIMAALEQAGG